MIKKERKIPLKIKKLEALLRRLPTTHSKYREIEGELAKSMAGYRGEQSLDYYLSLLPDQDYLIFHDLRLPHKNYFFQLDILILSASFFLIVEVKNISGVLLFDHTFHQLIRNANGTEEVFPDPILQVNRQVSQFATWLEQNKSPLMPIESLVVIANSAAFIKSTSNRSERMRKVIRSTNLQEKIKLFEEVHKSEKLTKKDLRKISSLILKHHTPYNPNILEKFCVLKTDLLKGVHCPKCAFLSMERKRGKWNCPHCSYSSRDAHLSSLEDYALLLQPTITNRQLRDFLQLSSGSIANKLLLAINAPHTGTTKGREYYLLIDE